MKIGSKLFNKSNNLKSFISYDGVLEIADNAFSAYKTRHIGMGYYVEDLTARENLETVVLPQCVQKIGKEAFIYCTSLHDFSIPESVTVLVRVLSKNVTQWSVLIYQVG